MSYYKQICLHRQVLVTFIRLCSCHLVYVLLMSVGCKRRMCHGIRTHIRTFLPLLTVLFNYFIYRSVLRHLRFYIVEPFPQSRLAENSFKLFITDPQEKLLLPNRFTKLCMIIKRILSLTFVTKWISAG